MKHYLFFFFITWISRMSRVFFNNNNHLDYDCCELIWIDFFSELIKIMSSILVWWPLGQDLFRFMHPSILWLFVVVWGPIGDWLFFNGRFFQWIQYWKNQTCCAWMEQSLIKVHILVLHLCLSLTWNISQWNLNGF